MSLLVNCCAKPKVATMDHDMWADDAGHLFFWMHEQFYQKVSVINRTCLKCGAHWYGAEGKVQFFTKKEWEERMKTC